MLVKNVLFATLLARCAAALLRGRGDISVVSVHRE